MTIQEFLEKVVRVYIDEDELIQCLWEYGLAIFDDITITTPGGVVILGKEDTFEQKETETIT